MPTIPWVEERTKLALAESQQEAIRVALASKVLVITGGPGVGKTTLVNSILKILGAKSIAISLCAPTGRAAKRLFESTGLEAKIIHRLLETDPGTGAFRRTEEALLDCDLLVVDETSMVDVPIMRALLRDLRDQAALLLVGDVDQLPSSCPGQVLADIIASGAVPVVRLTEVFRQAAESRIIVNAHRINQGFMPELAPADGGDFYFVDAADREEGVRKLLAIVRERIPKRFGFDPIRDIQVLCPMNRGGLGARSLNTADGVEPARRDPRRAFRLDLLPGRRGHAGLERLRQGGLQRRPRRRVTHRHGGRRAHRRLRWSRTHLWL